MPLPAKIIVLLPACMISVLCSAQFITTDTGFLERSVDSVLSLQRSKLGDALRLYNGTSYDATYLGVKGSPYFNSDQVQAGDIYYDGAFYQQVLMLYDLVTGELVIESYDHQHNIKLLKEKIPFFKLAGHLFVQLPQDSVNGNQDGSGFYDLVYQGKSRVLVKRERQVKQVAKLEGVDSRFVDYTFYFVHKDNQLQKVINTSSLLNLFGKYKNEVRSYLRKNNFRFKKDPEKTIVKAVAYYDQLN